MAVCQSLSLCATFMMASAVLAVRCSVMTSLAV